MRGDERPVVTNKPLGRRDVKTTLVINESPQRTSSNKLVPVTAEIYHEGYIGEKRYLVPDSNLDAMATLVNLKMRRRISIRYKHQTSFDVADDDSITQKLNRLANKIDSIYMSDERDDGSEGSYHLKKSVNEWNERDREDEESLSELQLEIERSYDMLEEGYGSSQVNLGKNEESASYLYEEVSGRSENNGMEVTRENSIISQTKAIKDREINMEANSIPEKGKDMFCDLPRIFKQEEFETNIDSISAKGSGVYYDSIWISPLNENKAADYNTTGTNICNDLLRLSQTKKDNKTDSILEQFFSNTNPSRISRASKDDNEYSITSANGKVHYNPILISQEKLIKDSESTKENEETDSILKKLFSNTNPSRISRANKNDKKHSITSTNGKVYYNPLGISQVKVIKDSESTLIPSTKTKGAYYSQLTPLRIIEGVNSTTEPNRVVCNNSSRKSSVRENKEVDCKHAESRDFYCNSTRMFQSREMNGADYMSTKVKGLNYDFQQISKQKGEKKCTTQNMEPIIVELDVESGDYYNSGCLDVEKIDRDVTCSQYNYLEGSGDFNIKRQEVHVDVEVEDSYNSGIYNEEKTQGERACLQSNCLEDDGDFYRKQKVLHIDVEAQDSYNSGIYNLEKTQRDRTCLQSNCLVNDGYFDMKRQLVHLEVEELDEVADKPNNVELNEYRVRFLISGHLKNDSTPPVYILHEYNSTADIFKERRADFCSTEHDGDISLRILGKIFKDNILEEVDGYPIFLNTESCRIPISSNSKILNSNFKEVFKNESADIEVKGKFIFNDKLDIVMPHLSIKVTENPIEQRLYFQSNNQSKFQLEPVVVYETGCENSTHKTSIKSFQNVVQAFHNKVIPFYKSITCLQTKLMMSNKNDHCYKQVVEKQIVEPKNRKSVAKIKDYNDDMIHGNNLEFIYFKKPQPKNKNSPFKWLPSLRR